MVTSRSDEPERLYNWYVRRGESENRIKDFKLALKADRLSCCRFLANQFRLLLHTAALCIPGRGIYAVEGTPKHGARPRFPRP